MESCIFRNAEKKDADRIGDLFAEMLNAIYATHDAKGYEDGYLDRFFAGGEDQILVAEAAGEVIAFLSIEVRRADGYVYLDDFSVTERYRRRGIGTELMRRAEEYARQARIPLLVLHAEKSNLAARRFYQRLGCTEDEEQGSRVRMMKTLLE